MHPELAADLSRLPALLEETRQVAAAFLASLDERPVVPDAEPPAPVPLGERGGGLRAGGAGGGGRGGAGRCPGAGGPAGGGGTPGA
ncbi:aspartate aminotransferase family protein, partial [Kitasatospora sp. NPDC057500]